MSTVSSGRSDAGKNCRGTNRAKKIAATNAATVKPMVSQFARIAPLRNALYTLTILLGLASAFGSGTLRIALPINGAKITETNHETVSEMDKNAKIEHVYSPDELRENRIG